MNKTNSELSKRPTQGIVTIDGKRYQVQILHSQGHPPRIIQQDIDSRPAQYQTAKSRGIPPQQLKLPNLPAALPLTLAAVIAISFLVAASMFSISLTAYSNSVGRVDRTRSFIQVE
ncbi:MAG: hypothetical protein WBA76_09000 [Phormidesmis sp.]